MRRLISLAFIATLIGTTIGCSNNKQPAPTEQAMKNWNAARAAVLLSLARDQYLSGSFDKSRVTLTEAAKLDPDLPAAHILSAKLYIEAGQLEAAERDLAAATALDPKNAEVEYLAGVIYQRWQQPDRALGHYDRATQLAPAELAYLMAKAETLVSMDRRDEALALLGAKVTYFEHSAVIRDAVGLLLLQQGRSDEAIDILRRATILSTDDLTIREHLADALFQAGKYDDCIDSLARVVSDPRYIKRGDLVLMLGRCQLETNHVRQACESLGHAVELMPSSAVAWLSLAKAQLQLGDLPAASQSLNQSLALDRDSSGACLMQGYIRLRQGNYAEALLAFQESSRIDPKDGVSLCMIGYSLEKLGRGGDAMSYYARALELNPRDSLAGQLLADCRGK